MKKLLGLSVLLVFLMGSCVTPHYGIKADLVGFSDDVSLSYLKYVSPNKVVDVGKNTPPYEIGEEDGYRKMRGEIFAMKPTGANTSLVFSKDVARKRVRYIRRKYLTRDPNAKIYMIIMTDGLENSSLRAAKNHHMGHCCNNISSYQRVVKRKTKRAMGKNSWQIYPIVFEGEDLKSLYSKNNMSVDAVQTFLNQQFEPLRGAKGAPLRGHDQISPRVIPGSSADEIANKFKDEFYSASFGFHIPKGYAGREVKMQFFVDSKQIAEFTGLFVKKCGKFLLKNVNLSEGLTCAKEKKGKWKSINRKNKKDLVAQFEFNDFKFNGMALTENYSVAQDVEQQGIWITNTEYDAQRSQSQNAYIIAILDGSESVGDDYREMKKTMMNMIDIITKRKQDK